MNSTEEEFINAILNIPVPVDYSTEYRIYYDDFGRITMCSMQNHPTDTQYIVVDKEIYDTYYQYRVNMTKHKLEKIVINHGISVQLVSSTTGYAVVKKHAGLIIESTDNYQDIEYYDTNH